MQKRNLLAAFGLFLLIACSSDTAGFSIAGGPLQSDEIRLSNYAPAGLRAAAFDVVSQDPNSGEAGLAGRVQPSPAEVVSTYAAHKFRATGGSYRVRLVIKQATLQVANTSSPAKKDDSFWSFGFLGSGGDTKAEMSLNVAVDVVASLPDGTGATISATTMQNEKSGFGSPEDNRISYMKLMDRALAALDGEIVRQLPVYFRDVVAP